MKGMRGGEIYIPNHGRTIRAFDRHLLDITLER